MVIERGPVRVFAQALMDPDPVYTSDDAPVPPTFPFVMPYWGSLGEGGAAGLPIENLRGKGRAILHGEQEFVYHRPPRVGDVLLSFGEKRIQHYTDYVQALRAVAVRQKIGTPVEIAWLDAYHARVARELAPLVAPGTREWLEAATRPLRA